MKRITNQQEFLEAVKTGKSVVFFHKDGCSNCSKMKPQVADFCNNQPDIKLYDVLVEVDAETKMPPDWILKIIPRKFTYPLIMTYVDSKRIFMTSGIFPVEFLSLPFQDIQSLSIDHSKVIVLQRDLRRQHEQGMEYINKEQHARMTVIERLMKLEQMGDEEEADWELSPPTISEDEKLPCDNCQ